MKNKNELCHKMFMNMKRTKIWRKAKLQLFSVFMQKQARKPIKSCRKYVLFTVLSILFLSMQPSDT